MSRDENQNESSSPAFPKPKRKEKKARKRLPPVRKEGKRRFSKAQHQKRMEHEMLYRRVVRPQYLMDVAREQGRLRRPSDQIPGDRPQRQLEALRPEEWPLCTIQAPGTSCEQSPNVAKEVHHTMGRDRRKHEPHLLTNTRFMVATCRECHDFVEANPAWAEAHGFRQSRHQRVKTGRDYDPSERQDL